jgi:hypothetical protein
MAALIIPIQQFFLYLTIMEGITSENDNVVSIQVFGKQNFLLLKVQRDVDSDKDFKNSDDDYYYIKFDVNTLILGRKIEL